MAMRPAATNPLIGLLILAAIAAARPALATTWLVDTTEDSIDARPGDGACDDGLGRCSLRAAVDEAEAGDEVRLPVGTFMLSRALDIRRGLRIAGAGSGTDGSVIMAGGWLTGEPLIRSQGAALDIVDCTLGPSTGMGLRVSGAALRVERCRVERCAEGGIWVTRGPVTVLDSEVSGNGCCNGPADAGFGMIIDNRGAPLPVRLERVDMSDNYSVNASVGLRLVGGIATLEDCRVLRHRGAGEGGIVISLGADVTMRRCLVSDNSASIFGGQAGGISVFGSTLRLIASTIVGNQASPLDAGYPDQGCLGAALGAVDADVRIVNSTLSGNDWSAAGSECAAIVASGASVVTLLSSTLERAPGITALAHQVLVRDGATLRLGSSAVRGGVAADPASAIELLGHSALDALDAVNVSGDLATLLVGLDIQVAALADNGGPLATHLPRLTSPLVDAGDPAGCLDDQGMPLALDQRGQPREEDGDADGVARCDIGAVERVATDPAGILPPTRSRAFVAKSASGVRLSWTDEPCESVTTHDIARASLTALRSTREADAPCVATLVHGSDWHDFTPAALDGLYWLVRPRHAGGAGEWEADSLGAPRPACP